MIEQVWFFIGSVNDASARCVCVWTSHTLTSNTHLSIERWWYFNGIIPCKFISVRRKDGTFLCACVCVCMCVYDVCVCCVCVCVVYVVCVRVCVWLGE